MQCRYLLIKNDIASALSGGNYYILFRIKGDFSNLDTQADLISRVSKRFQISSTYAQALISASLEDKEKLEFATNWLAKQESSVRFATLTDSMILRAKSEFKGYAQFRVDHPMIAFDTVLALAEFSVVMRKLTKNEFSIKSEFSDLQGEIEMLELKAIEDFSINGNLQDLTAKLTMQVIDANADLNFWDSWLLSQMDNFTLDQLEKKQIKPKNI